MSYDVPSQNNVKTRRDKITFDINHKSVLSFT